MATAKNSYQYRVVSVNDAGADRVNVSLTQVAETDANGVSPQNYVNSLNLNLGNEEAKAYWPGQVFTMTLAPASSAASA